MGLKLPDRLRGYLDEPSAGESKEMEIPAWWFDPEEPPRLVGIDGSEEISAPRRDGTGGSRKSYAPADFRQAVEEEGSMAAAVVV